MILRALAGLPRKNAPRWKAVTLLAAVSAVGAGTCLLFKKTPERQEFLTAPDPIYKYRCRFTVSTDWKCALQSGDGFYSIGIRTFTLVQSPLRHWIETSLLHRAPPKPHTITIDWHIVSGMRICHRADGVTYMEPMVFPPERIVTEHYFKIDNCPVTLAATVNGSAHATHLVLTIPEIREECWIDSSAEEAGFTLTDREMQQILRSFHLDKAPEKATAPIGKP